MTKNLKWIEYNDYSALYFSDFRLYVTFVPDSPINYEIEFTAYDVVLFSHSKTEETLDKAKGTALDIVQLWFNDISQSLTSFREQK